jgi:TonB family protein
MRCRWNWIAAPLLASGLVLASASAQNDSETGRKAKSKVAPVYPEIARRMQVSGKVKIEVIITPDGRVRSTRVVGGHPLLVQVCQDAVKEWKFLPAPEESTQIIEFEFKGN